MIAAALLAAAAAPAVAAPAPVFAPPLDRPITVRTEEERRVAGAIRHFAAEHRIVFRRLAGRLVAELTLAALRTDAQPAVARRFLHGAAGLLNRTIRFDLSSTGAVIALEDAPAVWAAAVAPVATVRPPRDPGAAAVPGGPLAAMPPERRLALLAQPLADVLAGREAALAAGRTAIALPAAEGPLPGTRTVRIEAGRAVLAIRAAAPTGAVAVERVRTVDRATGLLVGQEEVVRRTVEGEEDVVRSRLSVTVM